VRFVETERPPGSGPLPDIPAAGGGAAADDLDLVAAAGDGEGALDRWVFMSNVCKHCTNAGCLDACPTGALIRTEFETVIVQPDICNGCGYCVPSCPFGVINRDPYDGRAAKCTLCYDRLEDGLEPACAKACPTDSIQFGPYDELVERAQGRVLELHERGRDSAYLYGAADAPGEQLAGNLGAFFLLTEPPERFGLPAQADSPIQRHMPVATAAGLTAGFVAAAVTVTSFLITRGRKR
jgi:formate dehydrogenase iron-sulfur subunit